MRIAARLQLCLAVLLIPSLHATPAPLSPVRVDALTCEHESNPVGIGLRNPRLSWKLRSNRTGECQTAYQVLAGSSPAALHEGKPDLWDSGKTLSDQSVLVAWAGQPLGSRSRVYWQVRAWDRDRAASPWSEIAWFELGLLDSAEWKGKWITADLPRFPVVAPCYAASSWITAGPAPGQTAAFRRRLELPAGAVVRSGIADISAEGGFTLFVNGRFARRSPNNRPGAWQKPVRADFTRALSAGTNLLVIAAPAAGSNGVIAHFEIELGDGTRLGLETDGLWKAATAPDGEWQSTTYDDSGWPAAVVLGQYGAAPWGDFVTDNTLGPGRYLRKDFVITRPMLRARWYTTALGVYEPSLNGRRVGNNRLDPGWTDYHQRVMVQTHDVTPLLQPGTNTLGAVLGDGWFAGRLGWMGLAQYGSRPAFNAQLEITYADGSRETIATDDTWRAGPGEIAGSDPQWGEVIDARQAASGWDQPGFDAPAWARAVVEELKVPLVPQLGPPVRELGQLAPQRLERRGDAWIVDFGQNLVGHVRLTARGPAGTSITLRHGEMLNSDGSLYTANLRRARATDTFILAGAGERETFEPRFTFHGFRYAEVRGYPGVPGADDLRAIVVGSDTPQTGSWECSNPELNRLWRNILWGQRGNFLSVPTDCPQRDERMGWTGDAQVFAPTAAANADVAGFFTKWMVDVNDSQSTNGDYADVCPRIARPQPAMAAWGDAGVIIPWALYVAYGDTAFLADSYPHMVRWVEYCRRNSSNLLRPAQGVGDHLNPRVATPLDLIATAYFANSARLVARAAEVLGRTNDAAVYGELSRSIAAAFRQAYVSTNGAVKGDTQTGYVLALCFDLLAPEERAAAAQHLADDISRRGHLTTGFLGVGLICPVLTDIHRSDLAWQLVLNDTYPSWLFPVKHGATTIWERWDGWTPDSGFQDPAMNSFNHYALGAVGAWLYTGAAGIVPDEARPGYKHFYLRPQFTTRLAYVKATQETPCGLIASHWRRESDRVLYDVTVPPNATATLELPVPSREVTLDGRRLKRAGGNATRHLLGAGTHRFAFDRKWIEPQ